MRCPFHEHPPKEVTYSKDNPQAKLYHCPDRECGNKKKSITRAPTPQYEWVTTSVKEAEDCQFEPCPICFSKEASASDEKAGEAAEEIAAFENRLASIENRLIRLEVLITIVLTGVVSLVVKTFFT